MINFKKLRYSRKSMPSYVYALNMENSTRLNVRYNIDKLFKSRYFCLRNLQILLATASKQRLLFSVRLWEMLICRRVNGIFKKTGRMPWTLGAEAEAQRNTGNPKSSLVSVQLPFLAFPFLILGRSLRGRYGGILRSAGDSETIHRPQSAGKHSLPSQTRLLRDISDISKVNWFRSVQTSTIHFILSH